MRIMWKVCVLSLALGFVAAGCKSQEVAPAGPRAATTPDQVKLYQKAPRKYENLGVVTLPVTAEVRWDQHGDSTLGFDRMKSQAAKLGANGLLLVAPAGTSHPSALVGYKGTFYEVPLRQQPDRAAVAQAIYVVQE